MPRKKRDKSTIEPSTKPTRRTKTNKIDQELNNALSLVSKEKTKEVEGVQHQGTKNLLEHHAKSKEIDLEPVKKVSIDKHVESTRYKIAYVVDKLADELMREASKKTKKDKEHLKGITWSFGTLYDKLRDVQTDAQMVALPSKLLANVTEMLKAQAELIKASSPVNRDDAKSPVDITAQAELIKASALSSSPQGQEPIVIHANDETLRSSTSDALSTDQTTSENYVRNNDVSTSPSVASTDEKLRT